MATTAVPIDDEDVDGLSFGGTLTLTTSRELRAFFSPPRLAYGQITELLATSDDADLRSRRHHPAITAAVMKGYYVDGGVPLRQAETLDLVKRAFDAFSSLGACKVQRKPAVRGKRNTHE